MNPPFFINVYLSPWGGTYSGAAWPSREAAAAWAAANSDPLNSRVRVTSLKTSKEG